MSKTVTQSTLGGLKVQVSNVPETYDEYDAQAKQANAALDSAISNTIYRSWLPKFRSKFLAKLAETTGVARKTKTVGEGEKAKTAFDETEGDYVDRLQAQLGIEDLSSFQSEADSIAASIAFDAAVAERGEGMGPKLAKKWEDAAKAVVSNGKLDAFTAKYGSIPEGLDEEGQIKFIGNAFKAAFDAKMKAAAESVAV